MALQISPEARAIDEHLREKAARDAEKFKHLEEKAKERAELKPEKAKKGGTSWQDKITKMRETYPNAYKPWQVKDDNELLEKFRQGTEISQLSKLLGRHEGSIKMRLQKLLGEDVVQ